MTRFDPQSLSLTATNWLSRSWLARCCGQLLPRTWWGHGHFPDLTGRHARHVRAAHHTRLL